MRPVFGDLWLDDHQVLRVSGREQAIVEQPMLRQSPHQNMNLSREDTLAGKGRERQAGGKMPRAVDRRGAELSQTDGIIARDRGNASVSLHLKGETAVQSGGDDRCDLPC